MRNLLALVLVCAAATVTLPGHAAAADSCGRPDRVTNWIDSAPPTLAAVFGRPGTIVAVSSGDFPGQIRDQGAVTIHFDMYLKARVGLPSTPLDPASVPDRANRLFDYAVQQSGCSTPWIAENELSGAGLETPWSDSNAQYRQNLLTYLQTLAARGARPFLLVSSAPYTGGEAASWWQQVAGVADIVRETYFSAKRLHAMGPIVANRTLRQGLRTALDPFLAIGIPPSRLGVMLGFMSTTALKIGRDGLQPAQAWFDVVKWQALAARQVAQELHFSTIWSWGWKSYSGPDDPDFGRAACVWLWTRAPALCNGPGAAGRGWNASATEGQLVFPPGTQCTVGDSRVTDASISRLEALTGDRELAYSAAFARAVESGIARVSPADVTRAERALIANRFRGSRRAYLTALARAHVSVAVVRGILGDRLRREKLERRLPVPRATASQIANFYESYPDTRVLKVKAQPAPSWLGGKPTGFALESAAPDGLFGMRGRKARTLETSDGNYKVHVLGDVKPLGSMPLSLVAPAIRLALRSFAQGDAFEQLTTKVQTAALAKTICRGDDLPVPGPVELDAFVPFLSASG